jgi:hypothetical protein
VGERIFVLRVGVASVFCLWAPMERVPATFKVQCTVL